MPVQRPPSSTSGMSTGQPQQFGGALGQPMPGQMPFSGGMQRSIGSGGMGQAGAQGQSRQFPGPQSGRTMQPQPPQHSVSTLGPAASRSGTMPVGPPPVRQMQQYGAPDMVSMMKMVPPSLSGGMDNPDPPFDMNDFPALGGPRQMGGMSDSRMQQQHRGGGSNTDQLQSDSVQLGDLFKRGGGLSMKQPEFNISNEDFPALGGGLSGPRQSAQQSNPFLGSAPQPPPQQQQPQAPPQQAPPSQQQPLHGGGPGQGPAPGFVYTQQVVHAPASNFPGGDPFRNPQPAAPSGGAVEPQPQPGGPMQPQLTGIDAESYGMMGLLSVVRMTNPDLNLLALGTDLTVLGLNLNSAEPLYSSFSSPFSETPTRREPEYKLPACYLFPTPLTAQSAAAKTVHFTDETLFYMFYAMPQDFMQLSSANELNRREWRYHKDAKLWLTRVPNTEPTVKTASYERGSYYYWDIQTWQKARKDNFVLYYDALDIPSSNQ